MRGAAAATARAAQSRAKLRCRSWRVPRAREPGAEPPLRNRHALLSLLRLLAATTCTLTPRARAATSAFAMAMSSKDHVAIRIFPFSGRGVPMLVRGPPQVPLMLFSTRPRIAPWPPCRRWGRRSSCLEEASRGSGAVPPRALPARRARGAGASAVGRGRGGRGRRIHQDHRGDQGEQTAAAAGVRRMRFPQLDENGPVADKARQSSTQEYRKYGHDPRAPQQ